MSAEKTILPGGLKILSQNIPTSTSVSVGFWVNVGSRHETDNEAGYAHFVEHMLFKGTTTRTAKDIAKEVDRVGAYLNATTTKEFTGYFINIRKEKLDFALDILTDIMENSVFSPRDIKKEINVVLEEIKMYEDTPDEMVHDNLYEALLGKHPLGRPILGNRKSIKKINRDSIHGFYTTHYSPDRFIIASAGNLNHQDIVDYIQKKNFLQFFQSEKREENHVIEPVESRNLLIKRALAQVHFCLGFPGMAADDPDRHSLYVMNTIFGSSMSSRLFQHIREKLGLCYSIYSFYSSFKERGIYGLYAGTSMRSLRAAIQKILNEIKKLKKKGFTKNEIQDAKEHIKGHLALSYENNEIRMNRLARQEMIFGRHFPYDEVVKMIDEVNKDSIMNVLERIFPNDYQIIISSIGTEDHKKVIAALPLSI
ncbi:MAG: insulinase family protein [Spirochaetes bacterium]|nr:insulinase family protein [Spirochaetota bacterium]